MRKLTFVVFCIILFILIMSAYSNTFYSPPVLDDYHSFIEDETVYIKDLSFDSLVSLSDTKFGWYRWIPMVTFALDHRLGRGDIFYFHLTNFSIHILCSLAVMFLVFQLVRGSEKEDHFLGIIPSAYCAIWVSGLWALNPVQTNAVTYLVQRMAAIQTFFYVLSVSFYILGRRIHLTHHSRPKALVFYVTSLLAGVCGFLSKQNAAMLPIMLLITEVWFFEPQLFQFVWKRIKNSSKSIWILLLLGLLLAVMLCLKVFFILDADYATRNFDMWERLLTEGRVVFWYLTILICPLPSRLSIEHDIELSTSFLNPPTTLLSFVGLICMIYLALKNRRRFPIVSYGIVWFILNLIIESTIISLELVFEHRLYLPSIGFYMVIVFGFVQIFRYLLENITRRDFVNVVCSVFAILSAVYCLMTFQRNEAWRDFLTINKDTVSKAPLNSRAHSNLAVALAKAEKYEEAIQEAEIAIKLGRKFSEQYIVSASVIVGASIGLGNFEKAVELGENFLNNRSEFSDAGGLPNFCLQIAEAHRRMGQLNKACSYALLSMYYDQKLGGSSYEKKLIGGMLRSILTAAKGDYLDLNEDGRLDPGDVPINTWIAKEFLKCEDREEGRKLLMAASLENPNDLETRSLLDSLIEEDNRNEIQAHKANFAEKYVKNPFSHFKASMALSYLIRERRLPSPFLKIGEKLVNYAISLKPDAADARLLKGWYHFEKEEIEQAVHCARRALELDPQHAKVFLGLGLFLLRANEPHEALASFQKALELFPGYPKKTILLSLIAELEEGCVNSAQEKISRLNK